MTETVTATTEMPPAPAESNGNDLLRIDDLVKHFPIKAGLLKRLFGRK